MLFSWRLALKCFFRVKRQRQFLIVCIVYPPKKESSVSQKLWAVSISWSWRCTKSKHTNTRAVNVCNTTHLYCLPCHQCSIWFWFLGREWTGRVISFILPISSHCVLCWLRMNNDAIFPHIMNTISLTISLYAWSNHTYGYVHICILYL
jgi:hypothetical protein